MTRTIRTYKPEVSSLWNRLVKAGFTIRGVSNDGENMIANRPQSELIEELLGCDEGWLYVTSPTGKKATLYLVYGNEPGIVVCDYTAIPELDIITDEHYQAWENRKQPTLEVAY